MSTHNIGEGILMSTHNIGFYETEVILMSTHNIGFYEDLTKIIFQALSNIIKYALYLFWIYMTCKSSTDKVRI